MSAMDRNDFELRLRHLRHGVPNGAIRLADLAVLASALQELNTRIARLVIGQDGPGRSLDAAAQVAQLRLTGIRDGSTRLQVSYGEQPTLDDPMFAGAQDETVDKFWQIVAGIATDSRPDWVTAGIALSAADLVTAMARSATGAVFSGGAGREVSFEKFTVDRSLWGGSDPAALPETVVAGRLYAVNTETRRFTIRDDIGNSIPLEKVLNLDEASALLRQRVEARGSGSRGKGGELRLTDVTVSPAAIPAEWFPGGSSGDLQSFLAEAGLAAGPDPSGIEGMTGADVDEFLALIHG